MAFPFQLSNLMQAHPRTTHWSLTFFTSCSHGLVHTIHHEKRFMKDLSSREGSIPAYYAPVRYVGSNQTFNLHVLSLSQAFILSQDQTHVFCFK